MNVWEKLSKRVANELGINLCDFERLYPGYWQRKSGAWSWRAKCDLDGFKDIGSTFSARELLRAKKIEVYYPYLQEPELILSNETDN
jgi:hypothetical protein